MELKKHWNARNFFIGLYAVAFLAYIVYGLQPVRAAEYAVAGELSVPRIGLEADVTELAPNNGELDTPDTIVGSYTEAQNKILLIGHSSGVFRDLKLVRNGDTVSYAGDDYKVAKVIVRVKESIDMGELLAGTDEKTLVIMTCAGRMLGGGDATHRLIVYAVKE